MVVADGFRITDILLEIWKPLAVLFLLDILVTGAYVGLGWTWITPAGLPLPLLGTGLGIFLGVRNNTAYARWWEARTLWGAVVNNSRNFARGLTILVLPAEAEETRHALLRHHGAWSYAGRAALLRQDAFGELASLLPAPTLERLRSAANLPFAIQREMATLVAETRRRSWIDAIDASALNASLGTLTDAQGGLERIRNTPMPQQYAAFSRAFVTAYCLLLPFGIVPALTLLTPLGSALIALVFLALDESGRHLENPFADSIYDVPMAAIARTIEIDLKQSMGDVDVPAPLVPVDGILR